MASSRRPWTRWRLLAIVVPGLVLLGIGVWTVRIVGRLSNRLRDTVQTRFAASTGGTLAIGDVRWRWGRIDFAGVELDAPLLPGRLRIREVRVYLTPRLTLHLDALSAVQRVEAVAPVLVLDDSLAARIRRWRVAPGRHWSGPPAGFAIALREGAIVYRGARSKKDLPLATAINGWFDLSDRLAVYAAGNALADSSNLTLTATIPFSEGRTYIRAAARHMDLARLPVRAGSEIGGAADLYIEWKDSLAARLVLHDARYRPREGPGIGPLSAILAVAGQEARWRPTDIPINGITLTTEGAIGWRDSLSIAATGHWEGDVSRLSALAGPAIADLHGTARGEASLSGPLMRPVAQLAVTSDSLGSGGVEVRNLAIRAHAAKLDGNDALAIDATEFVLEGVRVSGTGGGAISPADIRIHLVADPVALGRLPGLATTGLSGDVRASAEVRVRKSGASVHAALDVMGATWRGTPIPVTRIAIVHDSGRKAGLRAEGPHVTLDGEVAFEGGRIAGLSGNLRLDGYLPPLGSGAPRLTGTVQFNGSDSLLTASGFFDVQLGNRPFFPVEVAARAGWDGTPAWLRLWTTSFPFAGIDPDAGMAISRARDGWDVTGSAWEGRVRLTGHLAESNAFAGVVTVEGAPVEPLASTVHLERLLSAGTVAGRMTVSGVYGDAHSFRATGSLHMSDLTVQAADSIAADVGVTLTPDSVHWASGPMARHGEPIAFTSGTYRFADGLLASEAHGARGGRLKTALAMVGVDSLADGDAEWSAHVADSPTDTAHVTVDVLATAGQIITIPFDTLRVRLEGGTQWQTVMSAMLQKVGRYRLVSTSGRIPVGDEPDAELDIPVRILPSDPRFEPKGNDVLGLLADLVDLGVTGRGPGEGYVRIGGPLTNVVAGEGWCEVHSGTLTWPGETWPTWQGVQLRLSVVPESRFLRIERARARVGRGQVVVSNVPETSFGADPLVIDAIGLNLGVIQVETPRPIPFYIPGGMPTGQPIEMSVRGRDPSDRYLIAGPWENPLFFGEIILSGGYFTFPLEQTGPPDTTTYFYQTINWQTDLIVGRDLIYETRPTRAGIFHRIFSDPLDLLGSLAAEMEARLVEGGRVQLRGIYGRNGEDLNIITEGIVAQQARMSVLDLDFEPDGPLVLKWDTRTDPEPLIQGRGVTIIDDSVRVYARLISTDPVTGVVREGGRLGQLTVDLDTDEIFSAGTNPQERQLAVLQMLGYLTHDPRNPDPQARQINTAEIVNAGYRTLLRRSELQAWRGLFGPFQRQIRRITRLDVLEVRPSVLPNLVAPKQPAAQFSYLRGTNWTVGQYIWGNLLLSYYGELELTSFARPTIAARQQVGFEWAISPSTRLQLRRDIDVPVGIPDTEIAISHRFVFRSY